MIKLILILNLVRLRKGNFCPAGIGKRLGLGTTVLDPKAGARNKKKKTPIQLIFNNPITSILPGITPNPQIIVSCTL